MNEMEEFADNLMRSLGNLNHLISMAEQHAKEYMENRLAEELEALRNEFAFTRRLRDEFLTADRALSDRLARLEDKLDTLMQEWAFFSKEMYDGSRR